MRLGLNQSQRLEQRLVQSPQMIQAMQILQLSAQDLEARIERELMENPLLEVEDAEGAQEAPETGAPEPAPGTGPEPVNGSDDEFDRRIEMLERAQRDLAPLQRARSADDGEGDSKQLALQNAPARPQSLNEELIEQMGLLELDPRQRDLAEYLIWSLDGRGYLDEPLSEVAAQSGIPGATEPELAAVLGELRRATHPGLGAQDLVECLLLQLQSQGDGETLAARIVREHLEDVQSNRLPRIAKATGSSLEQINEAIEQIRLLEPNPGREYGDDPAAAIAPDVVVEEQGGEYQVRLTRQHSTRLGLSRSYREILQKARRGDEVRQWVKKRLESARWFLEAIEQRESTLLRIAKAIFERQRDFLDRGLRGLHPLRMQEVADAAGVHISTVSRAVSGKYAETPRGIFPLKFFFTSGTAKRSGEVLSQVSIKARVRELIEQEDPADPLSDDRLAELLEQRDGVHLARRTVTKYRKALDLPPSSQRRRF